MSSQSPYRRNLQNTVWFSFGIMGVESRLWDYDAIESEEKRSYEGI